MKKILLAVLLVLSFEKCYAFEPEKSAKDSSGSQIDAFPKQRIWLNGGQLFRKEVQISYERFLTDRIAIELTGGYKYPIKHNQNYDLSLSSILNFTVYDYAERMPFSEGILGSLSFKIYPVSNKNKSSRNYISPQFFYRYRFFDHKQINIETEKEDDSRQSDNGLQSIDLEIYGGKLSFGRTISLIDFSKRNSLLLDLYGGFGYRIKKARINFHDEPTNFPSTSLYYRPQVKNSERSIASLQLGFKLGYQF